MISSTGTKGFVRLEHGAGGLAGWELFSELILPALDNPALAEQGDAAVVEAGGLRLAFTTDTFVVSPLFFPGGDAGCLAVNGTVNDLAMCGAQPLCLSAGLVMEEGLSLDVLERVLSSMGRAARNAGTCVVTGDTKVVQKGAADRLFVNTSGIGVVAKNADLSPAGAKPGDRLLVSGPLGEHGAAVLAAREGLEIGGGLSSDTAALNGLVQALLDSACRIHALRDPTRGGLAAAINEIAWRSGAAVRIFESAVPVSPAVAGTCEILGIDPLVLASEGRMAMFVHGQDGEKALEVMKGHALGRDAAIIGRVEQGPPGRVVLETAVGGERLLPMPSGHPLPRIC
ncbi:MAG: hydrogenase expression/formation protein HypE [Deltaproteobacteria bacterium]|nr:hydrogenase expression/formation protein HypE [Deltaproteobacteria bacterium]